MSSHHSVKLRELALVVAALVSGYLFLSHRIRADERARQATAAHQVALNALRDSVATRDSAIAYMGAVVARQNRQLRGQRREVETLQVLGDSAGRELVAHAERDTSVSDSLRNLIGVTVSILNRQAVACNAALNTCDSIIAGQDAIIDSVKANTRSLRRGLDSTEVRWLRAERRLVRERRDFSVGLHAGYGVCQSPVGLSTGPVVSVGVNYRFFALPPW